MENTLLLLTKGPWMIRTWSILVVDQTSTFDTSHICKMPPEAPTFKDPITNSITTFNFISYKQSTTGLFSFTNFWTFLLFSQPPKPRTLKESNFIAASYPRKLLHYKLNTFPHPTRLPNCLHPILLTLSKRIMPPCTGPSSQNMKNIVSIHIWES